MKIKRTLGIAIPAIALALGGAFLASSSVSKAEVTKAADYSTSGRALEVDQLGNVSASFTVSDSSLEDVEGWLLCLFEDKPNYDLNTRKIIGSADLHPRGSLECSHYFYAYSEQGSGNISVTWADNSVDQKEQWTEGEEIGEEGKTLADYFASQDWHIVIGPRHVEEWEGSKIGEGKDHIWENCDYYVGRKNALLNGVDGQTYLDLNNFPDWEGGDAKFGFYYFNGGLNGWSEFATPTEFANVYVAQYSLDFVPTTIIAARFNDKATELRWNSYTEENYVWNQSSNEAFFEYGVLGISGNIDIYFCSSWSYEMAAVMVGGNKVATLDHLKHSGSESENFNQAVALSMGDKFTIGFTDESIYGEYYSYKTHKSIEGNFELDEVNHKIEVLEGGNYAMYFNTDQKKLYITTIALAEADEWAQSFLGENCSETISKWSTLDSSYGKLSDEVKTIFQDEEHVAHDVEIEGYIALAVQRYDFLVENFEGYNDFMDRSSYQGIQPYESIGFMNVENNSMIVIVISIASISALAFTTLLVFKKKRVSK